MTTAPIKAGKYRAFIELPSATLAGYVTPGGIIVMPDWNERQEDKAAVIGTVVHANCPELREGDKVAVNYEVTSSGTQEDGYFAHDNCYVIDGRTVWMAIQHPGTEEKHWIDRNEQVIAAYRDGKWQALGNYVLLKKIVAPNDIQTSLILPEYMQNIELKNRGILVSGLDEAAPGSTILYEGDRADTYTFEGGEEFIVVMGKQYCWGVLNEAA